MLLGSFAAIGQRFDEYCRLLFAGGSATLELTEEGMNVLRTRTPITLTKPMDLPKAKRVTRREGDIACDEILFEALRALRKRLADERKVPAYVVFGDATLREIASRRPGSNEALREVPGIGAAKAERYGERILAAVGRAPDTVQPAAQRGTGGR